MHTRTTHRQHGAALATALFFLVILTLLGLAAMRAGNVDLRLSQNEVSRMDALQSAQTALDSVWKQSNTVMTILPGSGYLQSCTIGSSLQATALQTQQGFSCPSANNLATLLPNTIYKNYLYASVRREQVAGSDFAPVSALREGDSGDRYQLASFTIVAGYDRVASDDTVAQGGAEIIQGAYVKAARIKGLTVQ